MFACSSPASSARRVLFVLFGIEISGREVLSTNEKQLDSHSSQQVRGALRICRVLLLARVDGELDRDVSEARVKPDGPENEDEVWEEHVYICGIGFHRQNLGNRLFVAHLEDRTRSFNSV